MRKFLVALGAFALIGSACAKGSSSSTAGPAASTTAPPATAAECAAALAFIADGQLTIGTDNPAYPPYFAGGETDGSDWKFNDPYTGKGFEAAVAYAVATRLGFSADQVEWVVAPFNQTYKPGVKDYDFAIEQISYSAKRAEAVDFSESYYDVNQALVVVKDTPIAGATSLAELKPFALAAPIGTTSYDYIVETIQPDTEAGAYTTLNDAVQALNAGQIDGMMVDLPTALYLADPYVQEVKNSTVLAQFPTAASGEYFGMTLVKGSQLTTCVDMALEEMKTDGTLATITTTWLSQKTNVGEVPVFSG